jgi:hypothetical protein
MGRGGRPPRTLFVGVSTRSREVIEEGSDRVEDGHVDTCAVRGQRACWSWQTSLNGGEHRRDGWGWVTNGGSVLRREQETTGGRGNGEAFRGKCGGGGTMLRLSGERGRENGAGWFWVGFVGDLVCEKQG